MRSVILWIALIVWLILGYFYYNSSNECCADSEAKTEVSDVVETVAAAAVTNATGPLMFGWDDSKAITGDGWDDMRQKLLDGLEDNQILEITGLYRSDETNNSTFENLGLARAAAASKLFMPPLTEDRVRLVGQLTTREVDKTNLFESATFRNLRNSESVKEIGDKAEIRFPFNSTNKLDDRDVERYLDEVAERVKASGESVRLTGFTDSIGSDESNIKLGQKRADIIKNYLVSKGVSASKIMAASKGEASPVGSNETKEGRAQNRRTELQIIK